MTGPQVAIDGQRMSVAFDRFDLDAYDVFLRAKDVPGIAYAYDWERDTYTLTADARHFSLVAGGIARNPVIYALCDPSTGDVRYIGKSIRPRERLADHCNDPEINWRTNWLRSLLAAGQRPILKVLEEVRSGDDWQDAERRWIAYGHEQGWNLTNGTSGGDGAPDLSRESRQRIVDAWSGRKHRPGSLLRIGAASRGRHHTAEHKERMSALMQGRQFSSETRSKISAGVRKLTDEQVSLILGLLDDGVPQSKIARRFGVHQGTISNIKRGRYCWAVAE